MKDPRWVREWKAKIHESCCVIELGRIGLVRYVLYHPVGIQVPSSLSRNAAMYPKPNRTAASPQIGGGGGGAASTLEGIILVMRTDFDT